MPRPDPGVPPPLTPRRDLDLVTEVREYELIRPLMGGGVRPHEADPVTVVRAPSIRGQLRFWWRATRAGQFASLEEMKRAEAYLWGAASTDKDAFPSLVQLTLTVDASESRPIRPYHDDTGSPRPPHDPESGIPDYAAFPLQQDPDKACCYPLRFWVRVEYPRGWSERPTFIRFENTPREEIEAAFWAWETFGGIGARTRRGFGAIRLVSKRSSDGTTQSEAPPEVGSLVGWIRSHLSRHVKTAIPNAERTSSKAWLSEVPHLHSNLRYCVLPKTGAFGDAAEAWNDVIQRLKRFRQQRPREGRLFGRSFWPEPDAIRRLTGVYLRDRHKPRDGWPDKFPRAAFGLPIDFHFKHDADPSVTLQGREPHTRLASPLILRPLACLQRGDIAYVALAVILRGSPLPRSGLEIVPKRPDLPRREVSTSPLTVEEARRLPLRLELAHQRGHVDVLQVFLDELERGR